MIMAVGLQEDFMLLSQRHIAIKIFANDYPSHYSIVLN
jgi:hypothetical protein